MRKAGARGLLAEAYLQGAELELETGHVELALRTCRRTITEIKAMGMKLLEARGLRILGRIFMMKNQYAKAEANLQQSANKAKGLNADYEKGLALLYLAELYGKYSQKKNSRQRCKLALRQAIIIFRRIGAKGDLSQALRLQRPNA